MNFSVSINKKWENTNYPIETPKNIEKLWNSRKNLKIIRDTQSSKLSHRFLKGKDKEGNTVYNHWKIKIQCKSGLIFIIYSLLSGEMRLILIFKIENENRSIEFYPFLENPDLAQKPTNVKLKKKSIKSLQKKSLTDSLIRNYVAKMNKSKGKLKIHTFTI